MSGMAQVIREPKLRLVFQAAVVSNVTGSYFILGGWGH